MSTPSQNGDQAFPKSKVSDFDSIVIRALKQRHSSDDEEDESRGSVSESNYYTEDDELDEASSSRRSGAQERLSHISESSFDGGSLADSD